MFEWKCVTSFNFIRVSSSICNYDKNHAQNTYEQSKSRCVCVCKHFEVLTPTDGGSFRK